AQLLLFDCFAITFGDELLREFVLDFLTKSFVDHRTRGLARSVSWNFRESRKAVRNGVPFLRNLVGWQFNLQLRDGTRLLFHFNFHCQSLERRSVAIAKLA